MVKIAQVFLAENEWNTFSGGPSSAFEYLPSLSPPRRKLARFRRY